jgi:hypothetical protein
MLKPLTRLNEALGFISGLAQGLVQASQVFATLSDIQEDKMDLPLSQVVDNKKLFDQLKSAMTPDGVLGFMRGLPLADDTVIVREMMELSGNDYKSIAGSVEEMKKRPQAAKAAARAVKAGIADTKTIKGKKMTKNKETGAPAPENVRPGNKASPFPDEDESAPQAWADRVSQQGAKTGNKSSAGDVPAKNDKQAKAKMEAFSTKKYAGALYLAVKKLAKVTPEQINAFVASVADILSQQGIPIREAKTLRGKIGGSILKENLEYSQLVSAAEKAGITDENDQIIIAYKLAKMIVSDRADEKSGALAKVFPQDFKIVKVPVAKANEILGKATEVVGDDNARDEYKKRDDAEARAKNPKTEPLTISFVTDPYGTPKGKFIPLPIDPMASGLIVQGREASQEDAKSEDPNDDGVEYTNPSSIWYIDIKKLQAAMAKYEESVKAKSGDSQESTEVDTSDETKTVVRQPAPSKKQDSPVP